MLHPRGHSYLASALASLLALPLAAIVEPEDSALRDKAYRHPDLSIRGRYAPATEMRTIGASDALTKLAALGVAPEGAYLDPRSGRWGTLILRQPLLPGDGIGNDLRWPGDVSRDLDAARRAAWRAFTGYLREKQELLETNI